MMERNNKRTFDEVMSLLSDKHSPRAKDQAERIARRLWTYTKNGRIPADRYREAQRAAVQASGCRWCTKRIRALANQIRIAPVAERTISHQTDERVDYICYVKTTGK